MSQSSLKRALAIAAATAFACLPLFPSFITLSPASIPGISMIPHGVAVAMLAAMSVLAASAGVLVVFVPRVEQPMFLPLLLWLGAALLSAALGFAPLYGIVFLAIFLLGIVWHVGINASYDERGGATMMFSGLLGAASVAFVVAIAAVLLHRPAAIYADQHGRAVGSFILPGELAGYVLVIVPIALAVASLSLHPWLRALAAFAAASGIIALALSFSRTGWVAAGCSGIAYLLLVVRDRRRQRSLAVAIAAFTAVAVALAFNAHHDPSENYTRLSIWQTALGIVRRFPLTGSGPFTFGTIYAHLRLPDGDAVAYHAHDLYLTVLAETGIVGLLAMLAAWMRFGREWMRRFAAAKPHARILSGAIVAGLIGTLVQGIIDTSTLVLFGLWLPAMALALASARFGMGESP
ncbi:MAG: O-antigen ligase family protein [Candidatus Eremiobacteraeota bacterium]|nr:O-antigen ligase family protein [Candidatus Eremiobacteraeota bacterium]